MLTFFIVYFLVIQKVTDIIASFKSAWAVMCCIKANLCYDDVKCGGVLLFWVFALYLSVESLVRISKSSPLHLTDTKCNVWGGLKGQPLTMVIFISR
jgi:hypothetical protein